MCRLATKVRAVPSGQRRLPVPGTVNEDLSLEPLVAARAAAKLRHRVHGRYVRVEALVFLVSPTEPAVIVQKCEKSKFSKSAKVSCEAKKTGPQGVLNDHGDTALEAFVEKP